MDFKNDNIWLMKGDCLERMKEIPDGSVDMILTDPPYQSTPMSWDLIVPIEPMWKQLKRVLKPNGVVVLMGNEPFTSLLVCSNIKDFKYRVDWKKNKSTGFLNAKKQPLRCIEDLCVFYHKQPTYNPQKSTGHKPVNNFTKHTSDGQTMGKTKLGICGGGQTDRYPTNCIEIPVMNNDKSHGDKIHPTQKPVELMEYMIKTYTNEGETVLDFTFGSGATIKATKNLNRKAIGIEMGKCEKKGHKYEGVHWVDVLVDSMGLHREEVDD
ncbi:DNA methyltransferase [Shewanella sp. phage 1/40]|uniref:DNA methyltransferase n=1 Tax=Shewanella sp. phage 1/40 TaxID=1458860 RepID=UPI0004F5B01F|nr:DNA methyltransferase [Shewanella sp. phage 1/40]AHK11412.1 DNA methyltransferase [Shewanella sp. phage 1/40]